MEINIKKTQSMTFSPANLRIEGEVKVKVGMQTIECVTSFKYLGVILDRSLNFHLHITKVCSEMSARMYMINKYKNYFSSNWLKIFCTSIICSKLDYCLPVYGNMCETVCNRIDKILLRVARLVILKDKKILMYDAFEKLNWLSCKERYEVYTLEFIFKHIILKSPLFKCFPEYTRSDHNKNLRSKNDFVLPKAKTKFGQMSFMYQSIKMWNALPYEMKDSELFSQFYPKLREYKIKARV